MIDEVKEILELAVLDTGQDQGRGVGGGEERGEVGGGGAQDHLVAGHLWRGYSTVLHWDYYLVSILRNESYIRKLT